MTFIDVVNTVWPIVTAVVVFLIIIMIHEFGHFLFAKIFKVKVNEFSIGMGPAIIKRQRGETLYALRALPIGGYCAMEGEDADSDDERAFSKAKVYKRIIIVAAGAVFNIILGFLLMLIIVASQPRLTTTYIGEFAKGSVSNVATGLMVKDEVVEIEGHGVFSADDVSYLIGMYGSDATHIGVMRDGRRVDLVVAFPHEEYEGRTVYYQDFLVYGEYNNFFVCIKQAFLRTVSMGRVVWLSLVGIVTGRFGLGDLSGPVGVTKVVSEAVSSVAVDGVAGLRYMLRILCMITVNLGIFNLLPIPALDGSRILFLIVEGVRGKPIKREGVVHAVGLALLFALMAVLVVKDIIVWIR